MKALFITLLGAIFMAQPLLANDLDQDIADVVAEADIGTNGGEADVVLYNVADFSYPKEIEKLQDSLKCECQMAPIVGKTELLDVMGSTLSLNTKRVQDAVKRILESGKVLGVVGFYWTGETGDSEYCFREMIKIFLDDGRLIYIAHDSTT